MKKLSQGSWVQTLMHGKRVYSFAELLMLTKLSPPALRRALSRLGKRGLLLRLAKGLYANGFQMPSMEEVACLIYPPSYISLESALFIHGILDQAPYVITCVTCNKTKRFETKLGTVLFAHIKPALFFGYKITDRWILAEPEKAALDYIYLQKQNGLDPKLDEWNWENLSTEKLHVIALKYPATVRLLLAQAMPSPLKLGSGL